jgi:lipid-A-disaccharide synthase
MIVKPPPHFGLINLVLGERVVPELFQEEATPDRMSRELSAMIGSDETRRAISARLAGAKELLGRRGATERVAHALQPYLDTA